MSKHLNAPVSRLICVGAAKASTNAVLDWPNKELDIRYGYGE